MVPALTPERSASSDIFRRGRSREASPARSMVALMPRSRPERDALLCPGRARRGSALQQVGHLLLGVAGREQELLGVLPESRPGQPSVLAGGARELDRDAELAHGPLDAGLLDL